MVETTHPILGRRKNVKNLTFFKSLNFFEMKKKKKKWIVLYVTWTIVPATVFANAVLSWIDNDIRLYLFRHLNGV